MYLPGCQRLQCSLAPAASAARAASAPAVLAILAVGCSRLSGPSAQFDARSTRGIDARSARSARDSCCSFAIQHTPSRLLRFELMGVFAAFIVQYCFCVQNSVFTKRGLRY